MARPLGFGGTVVGQCGWVPVVQKWTADLSLSDSDGLRSKSTFTRGGQRPFQKHSGFLHPNNSQVKF